MTAARTARNLLWLALLAAAFSAWTLDRDVVTWYFVLAPLVAGTVLWLVAGLKSASHGDRQWRPMSGIIAALAAVLGLPPWQPLLSARVATCEGSLAAIAREAPEGRTVVSRWAGSFHVTAVRRRGDHVVLEVGIPIFASQCGLVFAPTGSPQPEDIVPLGFPQFRHAYGNWWAYRQTGS